MVSKLIILIFVFNSSLYSSVEYKINKTQSISIWDKRLVRFETVLKDLCSKLKIPGVSVAIIRDKKLWFTRGYGYSDIEKKIRAGSDTRYLIGSITKTFTTIMIMQMIKRYGLNLNDNISKYISLDRYLSDITIKQILSHTAESYGERFFYSSRMFRLLTQLIERISGKSIIDAVISRIINPLNMNRTLPGFNGNNISEIPKMAIPYRLGKNGKSIRSRVPDLHYNASYGLISTVMDLAKFDIAMDNNRLISVDLKNIIFTPAKSGFKQILPYGLGWFVEKYKNLKLVWHYGWRVKSYSSLILKIPDENLTLIILANSSGLSAPFDLAYGSVLKSPFAAAFLRIFSHENYKKKSQNDIDFELDKKFIMLQLKNERRKKFKHSNVNELVSRALIEKWRRNIKKSEMLMEIAIKYYPDAKIIKDYGNLMYLLNSRKPSLRRSGESVAITLLKKDPYNPYILFRLALFYLKSKKQKNNNKAYPLFLRIINKSKGSPSYILAYSAFFLGRDAMFKDYEAALKYLKFVKRSGFKGRYLLKRVDLLLSYLE